MCEFDFDNGSFYVRGAIMGKFRRGIGWLHGCPLRGVEWVQQRQKKNSRGGGAANKPGREEKTKTSLDPFGFFPANEKLTHREDTIDGWILRRIPSGLDTTPNSKSSPRPLISEERPKLGWFFWVAKPKQWPPL